MGISGTHGGWACNCHVNQIHVISCQVAQSHGIGGGWRQGRVLSRQQPRIDVQSLRSWSQRQRALSHPVPLSMYTYRSSGAEPLDGDLA